MDEEVRIYFRDQLRDARAIALRDSEAFEGIIFVLERMGAFLGRKDGLANKKPVKDGLANKKPVIVRQAKCSSLAVDIPAIWNEFHIPFSTLYDLVTDERNAAMHEGCFARHLTNHAVELSLVLEDSLMSAFNHLGAYMVKNPICAFMWQPLSFIRQAMLVNSFSYLPVLDKLDGDPVGLISDLALARYLRPNKDARVQKERLEQTLKQAIGSKEGIELCPVNIKHADDLILNVLKDWNGLPILVKAKESHDLLGILTSFDLL